MGALDLVVPADARARLDRASAVDLGFPHELLARPMTREMLNPVSA